VSLHKSKLNASPALAPLRNPIEKLNRPSIELDEPVELFCFPNVNELIVFYTFYAYIDNELTDLSATFILLSRIFGTVET